jgi:hypothetical protein
MANHRLPIVNNDDGTWGTLLIDWLTKEHVDSGSLAPGNGGHQNVTITAGTAALAPLTFTSGTNLTTATAGSMEYNGTYYFLTPSGGIRKTIAIYDDSSGATGDVHYRDASGNFVRVAGGIGTTGQALRVTGGVPTWSDINTFPTPVSKTSNYTIIAGDHLSTIFADSTSGNVTITVPAASSFTGYRFDIKRIDGSGNIVMVSSAGGTIDGAASWTLDRQYTSITVVSDGTNWYIL